MDVALIVGIVVALLAIVAAMMLDGNSAAALISPSSLVLVLFGSIGATVAGYRLVDLMNIPKALRIAFQGRTDDPNDVISELMEFAEIARRQGMLAMESRLEELDDPFTLTGMQSLVDGLDQETVKEVLDAELHSVNERHHVIISIFRSLTGFAPTLGMIGTVIGLVNMLGNLSDPSQLGTSMALALLTTLYGVLFANLVFGPITSRLTRLHEAEMQTKEMVRDAVLAIQVGVSPRVLVDRLERHLAPAQRIGHRARADQGAPVAAASAPAQEAVA
jgi:chemotaxis protein MotA